MLYSGWEFSQFVEETLHPLHGVVQSWFHGLTRLRPPHSFGSEESSIRETNLEPGNIRSRLTINGSLSNRILSGFVYKLTGRWLFTNYSSDDFSRFSVILILACCLFANLDFKFIWTIKMLVSNRWLCWLVAAILMETRCLWRMFRQIYHRCRHLYDWLISWIPHLTNSHNWWMALGLEC